MIINSKNNNYKTSKYGFTKELSENEKEIINQCTSKGAEFWKSLSSWGSKDKTKLQVWQVKIAYSIGNFIEKGRSISIKQANQGIKIIKEAERQGFKND